MCDLVFHNAVSSIRACRSVLTHRTVPDVIIDEAYKSKTVGTLGITFEFDVQSGVEYKAVFVVTAYTNGVAETETVENIKTCP